MCNKGIDCSEESSFLQSGNLIDHEHRLAAFGMDSPSLHPASPRNSNDEAPRVKFLCSFSGSILPRPQDGKLRYVGGETRIVSVPRDISYEELMARMRELYEGASILKYQQPDEDLDALVSVVNDDDVTNMMEEYDKLGSGEGFTRLRIFLFSHLDQDASPHYIDGDERDTERRYVDALNSLNESPEYRRQQLNDSPVMTPVEEAYIADQFFNSMNLDGSIHNQQNYEMPTPHYNLRHLAVPNLGSGQHSLSIPQRYGDDSPWSPAYYSPRCVPQDPHSVPEVPSSPSALYHTPLAEIPDIGIDRIPEERSHAQVSFQPAYDHQAPYSENMVWLPTSGLPVDKNGFPGNLLQQSNSLDGSSVCENCRMAFQRNLPPTDSQWKNEDQPQVEQASMVSGYVPVANSCVDCPPNKEVAVLNPDLKLQHGIYNRDRSDPRSIYGEAQTSERGWPPQHLLHPRAEEPRAHISGPGRVNEHYILDSAGMNYPIAHCNVADGHHVLPSYIHHDEPRYVRAGPELGNNIFHGQASVTCLHRQVPLEERGIRHANLPYSYAVDNAFQLSHGHPSAHTIYRNIPAPQHIPSAYDASTLHPRHGVASPGFPWSTAEDSLRFSIGVDQNPVVEPAHARLAIDGSSMPEYAHSIATKVNPGAFYAETQLNLRQDYALKLPNVITTISPQDRVNLADSASTITSDKLISLTPKVCNPGPADGTGNSGLARQEERNVPIVARNPLSLTPVGGTGAQVTCILGENDKSDLKSLVGSLQHVNINPTEVCHDAVQLEDEDKVADMSFLLELVAFVNKAKLESAEVVKTRAQEDVYDDNVCDSSAKGVDADARAADADERDPVTGHRKSECGSDNDNLNASKIEPTKAEEVAISRGLQTIKNDDLEEIRELGSGTYGSVYHGKWKGSDVAIKRIKASCFAGRPSERERLIADFWKEALLLSSLHHPNVVSFYGVVRDGPDGSLATVTEFMINGSLKQYLQKKDRTIDRRKRLIIAMDAAFGMEYLHGRNIVHFDLKCENLLVNMRDPQRPICKIGDLGLSKVKQHTLVSGGVRGTLPWMAPELLSGTSNMVTEKIDVYSFGIVMWELLTGDEPYADLHCASIIGGIVNNSLRPQIPTWCDPEWKALMQSCWAPDPSKRPSFSEISQRLRSMAAAMNVK